MLGYTYLLITIILFSSMEVAGRMIYSTVGPLTMTFLRFFIGFILIFFFILFNREERSILRMIKIRDLFSIFLLGFINVFLSMMLLQIAVHKGNASIPAILISSNPLFVYLIVNIKTKRFLRSHIIKIITGIAGITGVILFSQENGLSNPFTAFSLSLVASMLFALYTTMAPPLVNKFSNLTVTGISFLSGTVCYIPFIFIFEDFSKISMMNFKEISILLYMGIFITGIGYLFFFEGLKRIQVHIGSLVFFLKPVFALIFSYILLKESIHPMQIAFILLILYGTMPDLRKKNVHNN